MSAATIEAMPPKNLPAIDLQLAEQLHQLRRDLGLSVEQMATRLGLSGDAAADNVRQMERGTRPITGPMREVIRLLPIERQAGRYRSALQAIAGPLDDHELRQAARDALDQD